MRRERRVRLRALVDNLPNAGIQYIAATQHDGSLRTGQGRRNSPIHIAPVHFIACEEVRVGLPFARLAWRGPCKTHAGALSATGRPWRKSALKREMRRVFQ